MEVVQMLISSFQVSIITQAEAFQIQNKTLTVEISLYMLTWNIMAYIAYNLL